MSARDDILRVQFRDFGADLNAGTRIFGDGFHHFLVGSAPGREIKHVVFDFFHGGTGTEQIDLDWRLRHPPVDRHGEAILLTDKLGTLVDFTPVLYNRPSGTVGYHRTLELLFGPAISANAKLLLDLNFSIHFLKTSGTEEDKDIRKVPQPRAGDGVRLM